MIKFEIPSFRSPVLEKPKEEKVICLLPSSESSAVSIDIEMGRRQSIINKLLLCFKYKVGDKIFFKEKDPDGTFRILYITKKAYEIKDEWPKNDNPFLVTLSHDDLPNEVFYATTNKIGGLAHE